MSQILRLSSVRQFLVFFTATFIVLVLANPASAQELSDDPAVISQGESLFKGNCMSCHRIHEKLVGPALADVHNRRDLPWIYAFIRNSQKVIQSGDEYAVDLYNEYNQTVMTSFDFNDDELLSIVSYIKAETDKGPEVAVADSGDGGEGVAPATSAIPDQYITIILIGLVVILAIMLVILVMIINLVRRYVQQQEDIDEADEEVIETGFSLGSLVRNKAFVGIVAFVFVAFAFKSVIDGLYSIGVQQGYAPTQPIAFSHQIHAGQYEIECQYCHTGVELSKSANIPSANICMNCHSAIKTESPEIQKIYAAVENNEPIEWVRVHNLPDLSYFNHAQHVKVGNQECQTCHGEIEEMEVVRQHSLLTMGWCIDCHRETEVNSKGNDYYDRLVEYHSNKTTEPMTVENIGGLECSKCHY